MKRSMLIVLGSHLSPELVASIVMGGQSNLSGATVAPRYRLHMCRESKLGLEESQQLRLFDDQNQG